VEDAQRLRNLSRGRVDNRPRAAKAHLASAWIATGACSLLGGGEYSEANDGNFFVLFQDVNDDIRKCA
jgi:hypothetical protein